MEAAAVKKPATEEENQARMRNRFSTKKTRKRAETTDEGEEAHKNQGVGSPPHNGVGKAPTTTATPATSAPSGATSTPAPSGATATSATPSTLSMIYTNNHGL